MSAKQFFKGTAFKCIAVLVSILLVCGILLTICNSLFFVSAEEKLARAISKIYGEEVTYEIQDVDKSVQITSAEVLEVYEITTYEGDYLLKVTGTGGFQGGTVTCWIRVNASESGAKVKKITIDSNVGQSYIGNISGSHLDRLVAKQEDDGFTSFDIGGISTGASFSMGAIANATNAALTYINAITGGTLPKYYGYEYTDYLSHDETTITVDGETVEYSIVTQGGIRGKFEITIHVAPVDGVLTVTKYEIVKNGSSVNPDKDINYKVKMSEQALDLEGKTLDDVKGYIALKDDVKDDGIIETGATISNCHCYYAAAFALANYQTALENFAEGGNAQ